MNKFFYMIPMLALSGCATSNAKPQFDTIIHRQEFKHYHQVVYFAKVIDSVERDELDTCDPVVLGTIEGYGDTYSSTDIDWRVSNLAARWGATHIVWTDHGYHDNSYIAVRVEDQFCQRELLKEEALNEQY